MENMGGNFSKKNCFVEKLLIMCVNAAGLIILPYVILINHWNVVICQHNFYGINLYRYKLQIK